jgi:3',5'-cyclic-AMP phosphodiesterase
MSMRTHMSVKYKFIIIFVFIVITGCGKFEYSPYQLEQGYDMPRDLNAINISKLLSTPHNTDDTLSIVFVGDSQRFYDQTVDLVNKVNTLEGIDFFILAGDISDFGLLQEFLWMIDILERLSVPYMVVVGNHDLATSKDIYSEVFGDKNFSFVYKNHKFIFHDTNSREYNFNGTVPDLGWMENQFGNTVPGWIVGVSHVPPFDVDFDPNLEDSYKNLLANTDNFSISLHGHWHDSQDGYFYGDGVRYLISNALDKRKAILLQMYNGEASKSFISY